MFKQQTVSYNFSQCAYITSQVNSLCILHCILALVSLTLQSHDHKKAILSAGLPSHKVFNLLKYESNGVSTYQALTQF